MIFTITNVALYSGWGPEARRRNPGDELCHLGAVKLLEEQGITQLIDVRRSIHPILNPWNGDLIIGGGTVLPAVIVQDHHQRSLGEGGHQVVEKGDAGGPVLARTELPHDLPEA